jgi:hypothetical protein
MLLGLEREKNEMGGKWSWIFWGRYYNTLFSSSKTDGENKLGRSSLARFFRLVL